MNINDILSLFKKEEPENFIASIPKPSYEIAKDEGRYFDAIYEIKLLQKEQPENPYLWSHKAYALFKLHDIDGSINCYLEAFKLGTDAEWTATVAHTLSALYKSKNDIPAAESFLEKACKLDPTNINYKKDLAQIYTDQGKICSAIWLAEEVVRERPDSASAHCFLGYLLWQNDRNDEARQAYERSIELDPTEAITYNNLGVIYLDDCKDVDSAYPLFTKALNLDPGYTTAAFNMARTHECLGNIKEAAEYYGMTLRLNEERAEINASDVQEKLQELFRV